MPGQAQIEDLDRGAKRFLSALKRAKTQISVGLLSGTSADEEHSAPGKSDSTVSKFLRRAAGTTRLTVAEIGAIHELGLGVPKRSFIAAWVDEDASAINYQLTNMGRGLVRKSNPVPLETLAEQFGAWCVGRIQQRIADGIEPPNAESTIRQKGSSKPLINTGQMRSAISYRVESE
jgi:hypothetical protein